MKKLLIVLLACLTLFGILTACDNSDDSGRKTRSTSKYQPSYSQLSVNAPSEHGPFQIKDADGPFYDGVVKYVGTYLRFTVVAPDEVQDPTITVSISNEENIQLVSHTRGERDITVCLKFCNAGKTTLTFTLTETNQAITCAIIIKDDYDCNPGKQTLSAEEFVQCVRGVAQANGMILTSGTTDSYGIIALQNYDLTWESARSLAQNSCRQWWSEGYRKLYFTFQGQQPAGYMFYAYVSD